jgi:hypothetical protein
MAHDDGRAAIAVLEREADAVERAVARSRLRRDREALRRQGDARAQLAGLAAGNDDGRARPPDRERHLGRQNPARTERVLEPQLFQIGSSHLTITAAEPAPGGSTTSRRTSR